MAAAFGRDQDRERLAMLRRIVELEVSHQPIATRPAPAGSGRTRAIQRPRRLTR
jgi:hypothetical protein